MSIFLNKGAAFVLERLKFNKYQGYIVGGSVRDFLLGLEPGDFDITTDASPDEILEVFSDFETISLGKAYGTIGVVVDGELFEITTFRQDGAYSDGRRPESVSFSKSLKDDLSRRDFTINAMAMDISGKIYDFYGGAEDLNRKLVRAVGEPMERFRDDKLRILRGIRFASSLNFEIESKTYDGIKYFSKDILQVSAERIQQEFNKILLSDKPSLGLDLMLDSGLLEVLIPEIMDSVGYDQMSPYHHRDLFKHMTCTMDQVDKVLHLRLAALFHDIAKVDTLTIDEDGHGHFFGHDSIGAERVRAILKRFKYSKETIKKVSLLIENHMKAHPEMGSKGLKRQIRRLGEDLIFDLLDLMIADMKCTRDDRDIDFLLDRKAQVEDILDNKEVYNESGLAINGKDLIEIGYKEGRVIGETLEYLTEKVMEDNSLNTREVLLGIAKNRLERWKVIDE